MTASFFPNRTNAPRRQNEHSRMSGAPTGPDSAEQLWTQAAGTFSRWFPPALVYREWRLHRSWFAFAWLLLSMPFLGLVLLLLLKAGGAGHETLRSFLNAYITSNLYNTRIGSLAFVSIALGVGLVWHDHTRSGLVYVLSGPAARRDILRVKTLFGIGTIAAAYFPLPAFFCLTYAAQGGPLELGPVLAASLAYTLALSALFMTGLAVACACGNLFLAIVGALLLALVPQWLAGLLAFFDSPLFTGQPYGTPHPQWLISAQFFLSQLSPLSRHPIAGGVLSLSSVVYLVWYALWCAGFWWLARRLFEAVPFERFGSTFFFPALRQVVLGGVSFVIADVLAHILVSDAFTRQLTGIQNGYAFLAWFAISFAGVWVVLDIFARRMRGHRGEDA